MNESVPATSLVIAFFDDAPSAHRSLEEIREESRGAVNVLDAVLISLSERTHRLEVEPQAQGPSGVGMLSEILPSNVLAIAPIGRTADAAADHFRDLGFTDNLLKEIGENLPPDGVALLMIVEEKWLASVGRYATRASLERFIMEPGAGRGIGVQARSDTAEP